MEEAYELEKYLPLSFKTKSEQEYIAFLWDTFDTNYTAGKYQFAFLAYHMLTMATVYFNIWQIRHHMPTEYRSAMVGFSLDHEKDLMESGSPFAFHCVNESGVMRFMKLLGCRNDEIGNYTKLVKDRNSAAHCNAIIFPADEAALAVKVGAVLRAVEEIQNRSAPIIERAYKDFLLGSGPSDDWEYSDAKDQVREVLVHGNYMSRRDIDICLAFDVGTLGPDPVYDGARALHQSLRDSYAEPAEVVTMDAAAPPAPAHMAAAAAEALLAPQPAPATARPPEDEPATGTGEKADH